MDRIFKGLLAGALATYPMTVLMNFLHRSLSEERGESLPPRKVTFRLAEKVGARRFLAESEMTNLTLIAHYGYGSWMGGLYSVLGASVRQKRNLKSELLLGMSFGLAVWAGSYLLGLPSFRLYPSATRTRGSRNFIMISSHLVWGMGLALIYKRLLSSEAIPELPRLFGDGTRDIVDECSWESFPASDPPSWYSTHHP